MARERRPAGEWSEPVRFEVERGAIQRFAAAIGDDTAAYRAGEIAPPTFPTTFRSPVPGVTLELSRVLHGEEEYTYERPIRAGDVLLVQRRLEDSYERAGSLGRMTFHVVAAEGREPGGALVYHSRTTIIQR